MKKNGFISISVVYSFFLVFLVILLAIVNLYANNRLLIKKICDDIKEALDAREGYLNDFVIEQQNYILIYKVDI